MERKTVITDQMILKAVLLLRRCGNTRQTKEEQIAEQKEWLRMEPTYADMFADWIEGMKEELRKTPEELEEEMRLFREQEEEYEARHADWFRHERDEWDDLWADRARSVGAVMW